MKKIYFLFIFMMCNLLFSQEKIDEADLSKYLNKQIQYCDKVFGSYVSTGEKKVILLNLGADYPDHTMVVAIFQSNWDKFNYKPDEFLKGKDICVKGKLIMYKGKPEIIVNNPKQISLVE